MTQMTAKTAIVTGGGRGIGQTIAVTLGAEGYNVVVNYAHSEEGALRTVAAVEKSGGKALAVRADVANGDDRRQLLDVAIDAFGGVDLLVNNAGVTSRGRLDILDATEENFDWLMGINLKGPFFLSQLVARHMVEQGGAAETEEAHAETPAIAHAQRAIINVSSLSAYAVSTNRADYCIAKAGLAMATQLWAARLAEFGINVYELRPGIIASDMTAPVKEKYDRLIIEDGITPIRRWGQGHDVARAVVAIARGYLAFSTGETINVDGGFHIRRL